MMNKCYNCESKHIINGETCHYCVDNKTLNPFIIKNYKKYKNGLLLQRDALRGNIIGHNEKCHFVVHRFPKNGDSLFRCVSMVFNTTPLDIRHLVARNTIGTHSLKASITKMGRYYGQEKCIWGTNEMMEIICNKLHLSFVIFTKSGEIVQHIKSTHSKERVIFLLETHLELGIHYDLIKYKDQGYISGNIWRQLKCCFEL